MLPQPFTGLMNQPWDLCAITVAITAAIDHFPNSTVHLAVTNRAAVACWLAAC
jgi:hypothetical protein